jgi:hypothetical protein
MVGSCERRGELLPDDVGGASLHLARLYAERKNFRAPIDTRDTSPSLRFFVSSKAPAPRENPPITEHRAGVVDATRPVLIVQTGRRTVPPTYL